MLSFDIGCNPPQPIIQDGHDFEAEYYIPSVSVLQIVLFRAVWWTFTIGVLAEQVHKDGCAGEAVR